MMLPERGPGIIVKLKLLSCKKNSSLLDASFHMSVNQNDNHHGGPISLGIFMKAVDANLFYMFLKTFKMILTLKAPITTAADEILLFYIIFCR